MDDALLQQRLQPGRPGHSLKQDAEEEDKSPVLATE